MAGKRRTGSSPHRHRALGLRWGRLLTGIDGARDMLRHAQPQADLLSDEDRRLLIQAIEMLGGISQRAWGKV